VPVWRTSSYSASNGECVEVAALGRSTMGVRDSKDRHGPVLSFTTKEWRTFVAGVHAGAFNR
jgi:predicted secreted Zn-dependent protease